MTAVDGGPAASTGPGTGRVAHRRRWWLLAGVIAALAAVAAGSLWLRWLYSADALSSGTLIEGGVSRPVGATFYSMTMVIPHSGKPVTLNIGSVTPRISVNTARANVRVLICHRSNTQASLGADSLSFCASSRAFTPGTVTIGHDDPGETSIILAITTRQAGVVRIDGVHVGYRQGLRHGSQNTGNVQQVTATRR